MKTLITGICGFVGSTLARALREAGRPHLLLQRPAEDARALSQVGFDQEPRTDHQGNHRGVAAAEVNVWSSAFTRLGPPEGGTPNFKASRDLRQGRIDTRNVV